MKNNIRPIFLTAFCFLLINMVFADKIHINSGSKQNQNGNGNRVGAVDAEACSPASGHTDLDLNNVRARINTGGDMWWDLINISKYEIPKGSGHTSMFAGALWIGGIDINGQLKLAALEYRTYGNDYWPGPLTTDGYASIDVATCEQYDHHFLITRAEVDAFIAHWNCPSCYPDYVIPPDILNWPWHGDVSKKQSYYLAPFYDNNGDGEYNPNDGDYPYYDINNDLCPYNAANLGKPPQPTMEGNGIQEDQCIKGDQTLWWVFNDKGNIHTESKGAPIGFEIRAQAFAFSTNDDINNMTFYSYEIINRSTYTLTETYMSQWCDTDLGFATDDYVGCDIPRGMGYDYNGKDIDGSGQPQAYGADPPAIGMDFFQGPYMDPDGIDNPKYDQNHHQICDVSINGVNFGDGIVDNERFGMRRFIYFNNGGAASQSDPTIAIDYYNYLRGIWKDGTQMLWGGNAHTGGPGVCGPECDFMFPGNTDPCQWSTSGQPPNCTPNWTERNVNNEPGDRRFLQSAGPFTLQPGSVNYITVGVPWARSYAGTAWASVGLLDVADDKCQRLFDNCFKVVDGPDAPDLTIQELNNELIIYISNKSTSNNNKERYHEIDPSIVTPDSTVINGTDTTYKPKKLRYDSIYRFEGYQIFQLANATVSASSLQDPTQARLVCQCDIVDFDKHDNPIGTLVNYSYDETVGANVPVQEVVGSNTGIIHSFVVTSDQFATGVNTLVNHKQYYYMAIAYAYNNYMTYSQDPGSQIPDVSGLGGQTKPYLAGRKNIQVYTGIPHNPAPEANGTTQNAQYGFGPKITRIEGQGNGGNVLDLTPESETQILNDGFMLTPEYQNSHGPISVKVIDPLNVVGTTYTLCLDSVYSYKVHPVSHNSAIDQRSGISDTATMQVANWTLIDNTSGKKFRSDTSTLYDNEQLFIDRGISINIVQVWNIGGNGDPFELYKVGKDGSGYWVTAILTPNDGFLESSITYADSSKRWLGGIPDIDGGGFWNWIRSGNNHDNTYGANSDYNYVPEGIGSHVGWIDPQKYYQKIVGGTWAPYALCATNSTAYDPATATTATGYGVAYPGPSNSAFQLNKFSNIASVDIVFTSNPSNWSRCPVLETCETYNSSLTEGSTPKFNLRAHESIALDQTTYATPGSGSSTNINDPNYIGETGMGWFPGYAINVETGERLNIMFGENSALGSENGRDMKLNPTTNLETNLGAILWGGEHFVYIVGHNSDDTTGHCPRYDAGKWLYHKIVNPTGINMRNAFQDVMYAGIPIPVAGQEWLSTDVKIRIRVSTPYKMNYSTYGSSTPKNNNNPMYQFSTYDIATVTDNTQAAQNALDLINIVPNPYYGFSGYEANQLDNEVKITNLPVQCTISIYTINGTLVRQYTRDNSTTTDLNWDLKNTAGIPIAGGLYLIYVNAPGIGEKVIKWFGTLRPIDLNSF
jgi:hypothetical protein